MRIAAEIMHVRRNGSFVEVHAPAKLNFFLEVLARRADGYHEIETLMAVITIFDTLSFAAQRRGGLRLTCEWSRGWGAMEGRAGPAQGESAWEDLPDGANNIVWKAVERLRACAGVKAGASIHLIKRIPSRAGFGGASSDAAAALVAANLAWGLQWSCEQLVGLGAELGSDIPFFLSTSCFGAGAAVCRGRGDRVEPVASRANMHLVVARPPCGLSTAEVYAACRPADESVSVRPLLSALEGGDLGMVGRRLMNRLEPSAQRLSPWVRRMRGLFDRLDCLGHQMSGSGTGYFGICRNARHARRATGRLRAAGVGFAVAARTAATGPLRCFEASPS